MRITKIAVTGLFGLFDHEIPLNLDERTTIIHGPNGFGKTILLQMVRDLFEGNYAIFTNIPFKRFEIHFDDKSQVWVDKSEQSVSETSNFKHQSLSSKEIHVSHPFTINFSNQKNQKESFSFESIFREDIPLGLFEAILPVEIVGHREWFDKKTREILNYDEVMNRFGHHLPMRHREEPEWWINTRQSIKIYLIETQRLLKNVHPQKDIRSKNGVRMVPSVEIYTQELAQTIEEKLAESAELSQKLDRTFPTRLVERMSQPTLTEAELTKKLEALEAERTRLKNVGLLDKEEDEAFLPRQELGKAREVLAVYIEDVEQKLSIFDEIAQKIGLFQEIINKRFLYKHMTISKEEGFIFWQDSKRLPVTTLSSGEQHELVLLYQLLFKIEADSLILIDEPELSLHVAWQKEFLHDLQRVSKLASLDMLIATHSPQIIHDRWDLTVELKGRETA